VSSTQSDIGVLLQYLPPQHPTTLAGAPSDPAALAADAWNEVLNSGEFARLQQAISSTIFDARLDAAGLSGSSLRFKVAVVDQRRDEFVRATEQPEAAEEPQESDPGIPPERRQRRPRRIRRFGTKLLDAIDVILDSLVGALHGIGELIKEFKEALRNWLED
jgi:hypothetical protein